MSHKTHAWDGNRRQPITDIQELPALRYVATAGADATYIEADADLEALLAALAADATLGGADVVVWDGDSVAAVLVGGGKPEVVRVGAVTTGKRTPG